MDSITRYALIKCGTCGIPFAEGHPTDAASTCWRYRPTTISDNDKAELSRQAGLSIATVNGTHKP